MTTILLADDHQILRDGLRTLLMAHEGYQVVGETSDGIEAIELVDKLKPDVLIVDMVLSGLHGLEVIKSVCQRTKHTYVIVLSMHANEGYIVEALRSGASGYLLKESSSTELITAIESVMQGKRYLSTSLAERALDAYIEQMGRTVSDPYDMLTDRERQVFQLSAEGKSNAEIADRLTIGIRTVETHRSNILRKLSLKNQTDLIRYAVQRGLTK